MDIEKRAHHLSERLNYIRDIFDGKHPEDIELLHNRLNEFFRRATEGIQSDPDAELTTLEELFTFMERKLETKIQPMDKVRIVRHPQRICLRDILENVYDNFTEIGGQEEHSIDPSMLIARATITRRRGREDLQPAHHGHRPGKRPRRGIPQRRLRQAVGNSKALQYMKVAETEGIPIHTYVFTPGSFPIEDTPGAAQQIAENLYEMAGLTVPMVAVFSEGGSGGAEAISLADRRLMLSHGYYSVISPEGAAAIEGRLKPGQRATPELIERCATQLHITAEDNLQFGYIDRVIQEPSLGARPYHYDFFRTLRQEIIRATDETVLSVRSGMFRGALLRRMSRDDINLDEMYIRWHLSQEPASALSCAARKIPPPLARGLHRPPPLPQQDAQQYARVVGQHLRPHQICAHHQASAQIRLSDGRNDVRDAPAEAPPDRALLPHPARSAPLHRTGNRAQPDHAFRLGRGKRIPQGQMDVHQPPRQGRPRHHLPECRHAWLPRPVVPGSVRRIRGRLHVVRPPLPDGIPVVRQKRVRRGFRPRIQRRSGSQQPLAV
ncbi:MAG: hypothetical protein ACLT2T_14140 [Bilophila wadsworthia]